MSHLITSVNSNAPNVDGAISSGTGDFQIFMIGSDYANNFVYRAPSPTYPRALAAGQEFLWHYVSGYYYNSITGLTINNYSSTYAKSFTLPAGTYIAGFNIGSYTVPDTTSGGIRCSLTDGTTQYSGSNMSGRNSYAVYNAAKNHSKTRFTLSTPTTLYVNIDTKVGSALYIWTINSLYFIKEP